MEKTLLRIIKACIFFLFFGSLAFADADKFAKVATEVCQNNTIFKPTDAEVGVVGGGYMPGPNEHSNFVPGTATFYLVGSLDGNRRGEAYCVKVKWQNSKCEVALTKYSWTPPKIGGGPLHMEIQHDAYSPASKESMACKVDFINRNCQQCREASQ